MHKTRINEDLRSLLAFHTCISFVQRFHQARRTHAGWRSRARGRVSRSPVPSAYTCAPCPILTSVLWSGQSVHGRWLRRPPTGSTSAFRNLCRNEKRVPTRALLCSALRGSAAVRSLRNGCQLACGGYEHEAKGRERPVLSGPQRPPRGVEVWRTSVLGTACVSVFSVCLRGHLYANVKQAIGLANYSGAFVCARQ